MAQFEFTPIEHKEYTEIVKKASYTTFYNSPERLTFIIKRNRKTGLYKVTQDNSIVALLAYQVIPARSGSFVYFQHSPLFVDTRVAHDITFWAALKNFAHEVGTKESAIYVRFTPRIPYDKGLSAELQTNGFKKAPVQELDSCVTRTIDIREYSEDSLTPEQRTRLEKGQNQKVKITFDESPEALEDFSSIYRTLAAKKQIDYVPLDYLKEELTQYLSSKMLIIAEVKDEKDNLYASASIIITGTTAWYYWAATTEQGVDKYADTLMLHATIEFLKKRNVHTLDLWGGSISKEIEEKGLPHPWRTMDTFRKGFGAKRIEYIPAIDVAIRPPQYLAAVFYQRALMTKRGYPYLPL